MDQISAYYIRSQKFSFPTIIVAIFSCFAGLGVVGWIDYQLPIFINLHIPPGASPRLIAFITRLAASILLAVVAYAGHAAVGILRLRRKYPRYYIYCHRDQVEAGDGLVYGHFTIECSSELKFAAEGVAYDWIDDSLIRRGHWKSITFASNPSPLENETFLIFTLHSAVPGPPKQWVATFRKSSHKGTTPHGTLYEAKVQEFSWINNVQLLGCAEMVDGPGFWNIFWRRHHDGEEMESLLRDKVAALRSIERILFPQRTHV